MSNKRTPKNQRRLRRERREQTPPPSYAEATDGEEFEILDHIEAALAEDQPLELLQLVSTLISSMDPRGRHPFERDEPSDGPSPEDFLESMLGVDIPHTTAVLAVMSAMTDDELQAARIRREVASRSYELPAWLGQVASVDVCRSVEMADLLGGGENLMLGARLPSGHELTAVVYVDHDLGTLVKDAFFVPDSIDFVVEQFRKAADDAGFSWSDLDLADVRVRVGDAIERGAMTYPPYETDTWPACRPLVEWLLRPLPDGGRGYERAEWSEADQRRLRDEFFASRFGLALDDADHRSLLESLLWYGTDYGNGDPLRWSVVSVEILLADWLPRKVVADAGYVSLAPDLLRAFVRYAHDRVGVPDELTAEALAAVDEFEPDYQRTIRGPRLQGPMALLDAMGMLDEDPLESGAEIRLDSLRRAVGGDEALRTLDARPLLDEPFDWSGIPDDVHARVDEVRRLCDDCCDQLLSFEYRTACRRLLARAAAGDPNVFRRKGAAKTAAGAVCWIVGKANDVFSPWGLQVKELLAHLDVRGSVSQRAEVVLRAAGIEWRQYGGMDLESTEFLVSDRRAQIVDLRNHCLAQL